VTFSEALILFLILAWPVLLIGFIGLAWGVRTRETRQRAFLMCTFTIWMVLLLSLNLFGTLLTALCSQECLAVPLFMSNLSVLEWLLANIAGSTSLTLITLLVAFAQDTSEE
jgi:hypothetical protein